MQTPVDRMALANPVTLKGVAAYKAGTPLGHNPYPYDPENGWSNYAGWRAGWLAESRAEQEIEAAFVPKRKVKPWVFDVVLWIVALIPWAIIILLYMGYWPELLSF